ncbi:MAG: hypothetical protein NC191_07105 [Muribaculaceae bacterium]|nr:hypothetical protein [Muribaculaceae bacterium]
MKINNITRVNFTQQNPQPKTYYTRGTTVTLTLEEEALYRNSIAQTNKTMRKWMIAGAGIGAGIGSIFSGKLKTGLAAGVIGAVAGLAGSIVNALVTGKARYLWLPQNKIDIENGLARQNLATMNLKGVKNEN